MQFRYWSELVVVQKSHNLAVDFGHKKPAVGFIRRCSKGGRDCFIGVELVYHRGDNRRCDNTLVGARNGGSAYGCYRGGILELCGTCNGTTHVRNVTTLSFVK